MKKEVNRQLKALKLILRLTDDEWVRVEEVIRLTLVSCYQGGQISILKENLDKPIYEK